MNVRQRVIHALHNGYSLARVPYSKKWRVYFFDNNSYTLDGTVNLFTLSEATVNKMVNLGFENHPEGIRIGANGRWVPCV